MIEGLFQALSLSTLLWLTLGVMIGMIVGTLPGLTATMGTALLVPFTFALPTGEGIAMLGGLYVCAMFSDAIPACLVNTPGTPAAMATAFDKYTLPDTSHLVPPTSYLRPHLVPPTSYCLCVVQILRGRGR